MKPRARHSLPAREVILFGGVGIAASAVHYVVALSANELDSAAPWVANMFGWLVAVPVSYFGHACVTFASSGYERNLNLSHVSAARFVCTALLTLAVSQCAILVFIGWLSMAPRIAFASVIAITATVSFLVNKYWAFNPAACSSLRL